MKNLSECHGKPLADCAVEIHVSVNGSDLNDGSAIRPFKTISAAAHIAQPGDKITVHAGVYRERISPPRGGTADDKRIIYQAAPGEKIEIKGSEVIKNWVKIQDDVWKVILPNTFFGGFNPYSDLIRGDWFDPMGRQHHTGAVYLNGDWLSEAAHLEDVLRPAGTASLWFGQVDEENTTIWARFKGVNPNEQLVEINARRTVFYPEKPGVDYITVSGFTMRHAATPWAPPTAEQIGLIGTHWSKGWIIENNVISHSICVGVALGKYGDEWDNTSMDTAEGYVKTIERAVENGWNKETIGHHIVRNNIISDCEQAGIVGSLGAIFSQITDNHIYNIWTKRQFAGAEIAGIKIHASIDVLIKNNRVHNVGRGIWMDWMAQGTRITGNVCYDNSIEDLFMEVNHGPYLCDNNIFLSARRSLLDMSEGGAFAHNLIGSKICNWPESRLTPYHQAHSTAVLGLTKIEVGDNRYFNNIFVGNGKEESGDPKLNPNSDGEGRFGLRVYDARELPPKTGGNVYYNGAHPCTGETNQVEQAGIDPKIQVVEKGDQVYLHLTFGPVVLKAATTLVTTDLLGKARVPGLAYENPNGSPLQIDTDYFGKKRSLVNPSTGPFELPGADAHIIKIWG